MSATPLYSIITVCLNDRGGLHRTHASLADQTWHDFEWLVQDGGSVDGTPALLTRLTRPEPSWRTAPDRGCYHAMNLALDRATGRFVLFLNAGDTLAGGDTLARLAPTISMKPEPDLAYGDAWEDTSRGWRLKRARDHRSAAWFGMFTHHQAMIYRRAALGPLRFRQDYRIAADYAFTMEALGASRAVKRLDLPICRFAAGGLSQRSAALGRFEQACIRRDLLRLPAATVATIGALQRVSLMLRRGWPWLYGSLRYGRGGDGGGVA